MASATLAPGVSSVLDTWSLMRHRHQQGRAVVGHQNLARVAIGEHSRNRDLERIPVDAGLRGSQAEHQVTALLAQREVSQQRADRIRDNPRRAVLVGVVGGAH